MSDENIAKYAAHPSMASIVQSDDEHFVVRFTFASSGAALNVEIVEVLTREIDVFCQSLYEFCLNDG